MYNNNIYYYYIKEYITTTNISLIRKNVYCIIQNDVYQQHSCYF